MSRRVASEPEAEREATARGTPLSSPTRGERGRVLDRLEGGVRRVHIRLHLAGVHVLDRQRDLDVREAAGEDPVTVVEAAASDDLDDHLDVPRAEEPEIAGVSREGTGRPVAARALRRNAPVGSDAKTSRVQAEAGRIEGT